MNLGQRQGCLTSPFLLLRSIVPDALSTLPSGICFLASARFHLSQITTSSFSFKIEITIFNKWNASTCVPQVMSLCRNSLFSPRYWCCWLQGRKPVVKSASRLAGCCCLGQPQYSQMPEHGGNLKTATLEWVPGGRGRMSRV